MKKNDKRQLKLLKEFEHLSDEAFITVLEHTVTHYACLLSSEKIAGNILNKYGIYPTFSSNERKKEHARKIIECASLRNVEIPIEWYIITPSEEDVINRILEARHEWIAWIKEHNFLFTETHGIYSSKLSPSEQRNEINKKFKEILNKEFSKPYKKLK